MNLNKRSISSLLISTNFIIFLILLITTYILTYNVYAKNIKEASDSLIQETSNQLVYNYEGYVSNVIQISKTIQNNIQNDTTENYESTNSLLDTLMIMNPEILSIGVYDKASGNMILGTKPDEDDVREATWFKQANTDSTIHFFSPVDSKNETYLVYFSKQIPITKKNDKAILKLEIDFTDIIDLGFKTDLGKNGHTLIIDENYNLVYSTSESYNEDEIDLLRNTVLGMTKYSHDGDSFTVSLQTISNSRWRIAVFYNTNDVTSTLNSFILSLFLFEIGIFIIGSFVILLVTKALTNPLKKLDHKMTNTDLKNDNESFEPKNAPKEIVSLAESYNLMIEEIRGLINRVREEQKNQRKSELKALQNQINPHFLYNTLDSIVWMIDMDQKTDAQNMIIALAKLFRISISRGNNIIPVKDEIEHVKNYLYIQSMRYKDAFTFEIKVDPECYKYKVMKLILQPIVENSIYHGLKNRVDAGLILIEGHMEESNLILSITDNGYGMSEEKIQDLYAKFNNPDLNDGVGLKNVYQRLKLYYGEKSYLKIFSEEDEYTKIVISIPVEVMDNEA